MVALPLLVLQSHKLPDANLLNTLEVTDQAFVVPQPVAFVELTQTPAGKVIAGITKASAGCSQLLAVPDHTAVAMLSL